MDPHPKTWVAIYRRPEGAVPFDYLMDLCFQRLVASSGSLALQGVMLPHTIVFRPGEQIRWYFTSEGRGICEKKQSQINPTSIRRALLVSGPPEGPVAVWHSERRDSKGFIYTQEFFDEKQLAAFLKHRSDRGKCGVLQKFILPKDIKGKEGVNHELLVVSDQYLTIERRFNLAPLEPSKLYSLSQQACVHPLVPVVGRYAPPPGAQTSPHPPSDVQTGYDELQSSSLLTVLAPAMRTLTERLCAVRHDSLVDSVFKERELSCTFKVDRSNQLWLLLFMRLRSVEAAGDYIVPDFEIIRRRRKVTEVDDKDGSKAPEFNFNLSPEAQLSPETVPRPMDPRPVKKMVVPVRPANPNMFKCPNCSRTVNRDEIHLTTYQSILRYFDRKTKERVRMVRGAMHTATHGDFAGGADAQSPPPPTLPLPSAMHHHGETYPGAGSHNHFPSSPLTPTNAMEARDAAAFFEKSPNWVPIPPVLDRLSKSIEELRTSKVWLERQVQLCKTCYMIFFDPKDENEQLQRCYERESAVKETYLDRTAVNHYKSFIEDRVAIGDPEYPLVQEMVFTNLQQHHRTLQVKTRRKLQQRRVLHSAGPGRGGGGPGSPLTPTPPQATSPQAHLVGTAHTLPAPPPPPPAAHNSTFGSQPHAAVRAGAKPPGYTRLQFGPQSFPITSAWAIAQSPRTPKPPQGPPGGGADGAAGDTLLATGEGGGDAAGTALSACDALFAQLEPSGAAETEAESSASTILCNQLYNEFMDIVKFGRPEADELSLADDLPPTHRLYPVYGNYQLRFALPQPRIVMAVDLASPALLDEREQGNELSRHRNSMYAKITDMLPLFGTLKPEERDLLLGVMHAANKKDSEKEKNVKDGVRKKA